MALLFVWNSLVFELGALAPLHEMTDVDDDNCVVPLLSSLLLTLLCSYDRWSFAFTGTLLGSWCTGGGIVFCH